MRQASRCVHRRQDTDGVPSEPCGWAVGGTHCAGDAGEDIRQKCRSRHDQRRPSGRIGLA